MCTVSDPTHLKLRTCICKCLFVHKAFAHTVYHQLLSVMCSPICLVSREGVCVCVPGLCVHALVCVTISMSRLCLRSIRHVRRPADKILIMPADVSGVAHSVSAG